MKDFKAILADAKQADVSIKRFDRSLENLRDTLNKWESMSTTKPLNGTVTSNIEKSRKHTDEAIAWLEDYKVWLDHKDTANNYNTKKLTACPNCQSPIKSYISPGVIRRVCSKRCQGYKVIQEVDPKTGAVSNWSTT